MRRGGVQRTSRLPEGFMPRFQTLAIVVSLIVHVALAASLGSCARKAPGAGVAEAPNYMALSGGHRAGAMRQEAVGGGVPLFNTEAYDRINDNAWTAVADQPLSTFSADVDTASYSNVRRFL